MEMFKNINILKHIMAVKTITVTRDAYDALLSLKERCESFSDTILRIARKRKLSDFIGCLPEDVGEALTKSVKNSRARSRKSRERRIQSVIASLGGSHGRA